MSNKRSKPVDSSDPNSSERHSTNKRLCLDAHALSEKSKNSLLRSSVTSAGSQRKRSALEGDRIPSSLDDFLSGVFSTRTFRFLGF
jgi:hypothetical protein